MITHLRILDSSLQSIATIFEFISCIWTTQYYGAGEFELVVEYSPENLAALQIGYYVVKNNTNEIAVIEKVRYEYSPDEGGKIIASGRMAVSLLDRRLMYTFNSSTYRPNIFTYCSQNGNMEVAARHSVEWQAIDPTFGGAGRIISPLQLGTLHGYTEKATRRISTYQNLYTALTSFLATKNMAHRITYNADNSTLEYEVFKGADKSQQLVFSRYLENLLSFAYETDKTDYKNLVYIGGTGDGLDRFVTAATVNTYQAGTERREVFYSASSDLEEGTTNAAYAALIQAEAKQECREFSQKTTVEAEIDLVNSGLEFGVDYNVGDIILIKDIVDFKPRITTVIESQSADGYTVDVEFNEDAPEEESE